MKSPERTQNIKSTTGTSIPSEQEPHSLEDTLTPLQKCSGYIDGKLSHGFKVLGEYNGEHPYRVILISVIIVAICASGLSLLYNESRGDYLWVPQGTKAIEDRDFYQASFTREVRVETTILVPKNEGDNVLTKDFLNKVFDFYDETLKVEATAEDKLWNFENLCFKQGPSCFVSSILSKWNMNRTAMMEDTDIIATINQGETDTSLEGSLGGITKSGGQITQAKALKFNLFLANREKIVDGDAQDIPAETWEGAWLAMARNYTAMKVFPQAARSFSDEFGGAIRGDLGILSSSYFLIIFYMIFMLGKFNKLESRIVLSGAGAASIGLSIAMGFGLSSFLGQFYGPVHSVLPFVIIGVGVDDSFVIYDAFKQTNYRADLPHRMASALSHAGVSITVTSLTDFLAFMIGYTTVLPALSSFCVYAAITIVSLWFLQITFFSACVVLDERRILHGRADCCCCTNNCCDQHERLEHRQKEHVDQTNRMMRFLGDKYTPFILKPAMRWTILVLTLAILGGAIYSATNLQESSDQSAYIPGDSYLQDNIKYNNKYFSNAGVGVNIVTKKFNYFEKQDALASIPDKIKDTKFLRDPNGPTFSSWYAEYLTFLNSSSYASQLTAQGRPPTEAKFFEWLNVFLSGRGARFASDVVFDNDAKTSIKASQFSAQFDPLKNSKEQVEAMRSIRASVLKIDVPTIAFSFGFLNYEQFAVIERELYTNLSLAAGSVFVITLMLIAHPLTAFLVTLCVAMTIGCVLGGMWLWNVPIEAVSAVNLVVAIGLAVDYAAHIGHSFMNKLGTREERVAKTMREIGASVLNGGISTFLATVLLSGSLSYIFVVFFKMFFMTVCAGLYFGLVFLPVALATVGPKPSPFAILQHSEDNLELADLEHGLGSVEDAEQKPQKQQPKHESAARLANKK